MFGGAMFKIWAPFTLGSLSLLALQSALFGGVFLGVGRLLSTSAEVPAENAVGKRGRLLFLDALRGFAALIVVVEHASEIVDEGFADHFTRFARPGIIGVGVFFVISGFVILRSLERDSTPRVFGTHRFFRIAPLYYCGLLVGLAFAALGLFGRNARHGGGGAPAIPDYGIDAILNWTMMAGYFGRPALLGVYWTLGFEWAFYLLAFGLVRAAVAARRAGKWRGGIAVPAAVAVCAAFVAGVLVSGTQHVMYADHLVFFALFAVGMLFHEMHKGVVSRRTVIGLTIALLIFNHMARVFERPQSLGNFFALHMPVPVAVFVIAYSLRHCEVPAILVWFGKISFSVYVVHAVVVQSLPSWPGAGILYVVAVFAITIPIAALTQRFIEEPGVALAKRLAPHSTRPFPTSS